MLSTPAVPSFADHLERRLPVGRQASAQLRFGHHIVPDGRQFPACCLVAHRLASHPREFDFTFRAERKSKQGSAFTIGAARARRRAKYQTTSSTVFISDSFSICASTGAMVSMRSAAPRKRTRLMHGGSYFTAIVTPPVTRCKTHSQHRGHSIGLSSIRPGREPELQQSAGWPDAERADHNDRVLTPIRILTGQQRPWTRVRSELTVRAADRLTSP